MVSLNFKIIRLMGGLLVFTAAAIMLAVWGATNKHAQEQVFKNIQTGQNVLSQNLVEREMQLSSSAQVLASDFGFKQAVATGDIATIESVLSNHGSRIEADMMALFDVEGKLIAISDRTNLKHPQNLSISPIAIVKDGTSLFLNLDNIIYQCILVRVKAPLPIATTLVGFQLDESFVDNLSAITNLEVTLFQEEGTTATKVISTLKDRENNFSEILSFHQTTKEDFSFFSRQQYISNYFWLSEDKYPKIGIALSENVAQLFSDFQLLQLNIFLIGLAALLLTLFWGAMFAKNLNKPLYRFVKTTEKIAKGDYDYQIESSHSVKEIGQLEVAISAMQQGIKSRQKEIEYRAKRDQLTDLFNRFEMESLLSQKLKGNDKIFAVGLKVLNLKPINLAFGHEVGDAYLKSIAKRLSEYSGEAAYLGSGEFIWHPKEKLDTTQLNDVKSNLAKVYKIEGTQVEPKVSLATLDAVREVDNGKSIIRKLGLTLASSLANEQGISQYSEAMEHAFKHRIELLQHLEKAIKINQSELSVHYQPKVNLLVDEAPKMEALLRWRNETLGFVSPEDFIPIAEASGLINEITFLVFFQVIRDIKHWKESGVDVSVAINLAADDIKNDAFLAVVQQTLKQEGLDDQSVSFEITEGELVRDDSHAITVLNQFRTSGFGLSIDDFGTGYSSLSYLKNMPVSELKIDKSFVLNLENDENDQNIVKTIISLAKTFKFKTVAEGVETKKSLELLRSWDCDWIQGYFISKPMPSDAVVDWVKTFTNESTNETSVS